MWAWVFLFFLFLWVWVENTSPFFTQSQSLNYSIKNLMALILIHYLNRVVSAHSVICKTRRHIWKTVRKHNLIQTRVVFLYSSFWRNCSVVAFFSVKLIELVIDLGFFLALSSWRPFFSIFNSVSVPSFCFFLMLLLLIFLFFLFDVVVVQQLHT